MSITVEHAAHLITSPVSAPVDLLHLDAVLSTLCRAERAVAALASDLAEAREAVAARPDDPEAARRVAMAGLRMRGDAHALAQDFALLARPEA